MARRPPGKLGQPGKRLLSAISAALPAGMELDEREQALLDLAARQADDIGRCEADIAKRGHLVPGSKNQEVINPSVAEARQGRLALGKLLAQLEIPADVERLKRQAS